MLFLRCYTKIDEKVNNNDAKGEVYSVNPFMETFFAIVMGNSILNVDIVEKTCTCHRWQMYGIPHEHAYAVILFISQNVVDFVDDMFKLLTYHLVYSGVFSWYRDT